MANTSINDLAFLNQKIRENEAIRAFLSQATALIDVALDRRFLRRRKVIIELYLWNLFNLVDTSRELSDITLQSLREMRQKIEG